MDIKIDFSQTSPEYFLNKSNDLETMYCIEFQVTEQYIAGLDPHYSHKGHKVGDIWSMPPEWPINPQEAFELFKNFYAKQWLLVEVGGFLDKFYSWNEKAMNEELLEIKQFITESAEIPSKTVFNKNHYCTSNVENQKILFQRIENNYYLINTIQNDFSKANAVYGRYFLFKKLLEQKLNINKQIQSDLPEKLEAKKPLKYITKNADLMLEVYNICKTTFDCEYLTFRESIEAANFCLLNIKKWNFVKDLTYRLSGIMGNDWYGDVCKSMSWKKSECSGQGQKLECNTLMRKLNKKLPRPEK